MKYRKKPVIIEAEPYSKGMEDCWLLNGVAYSSDQMEKTKNGLVGDFEPAIKAKDGPLIISPGDLIITDVYGNRRPISPEELGRDYEPATEDILTPAAKKPVPKKPPAKKPAAKPTKKTD